MHMQMGKTFDQKYFNTIAYLYGVLKILSLLIQFHLKDIF